MPSIPLPGETFTFAIPLVSQASSHVFQAAPTIAAGDFKRSINNGAFANMDNLPAVTPAAGKLVQFVVSASETTAAGEGGTIDIVGSDAAGAEWDDIGICLRVGVIAANAAQLSGDAGAADNLELFFDGTGYASAGSINSVSGSVGGNVEGKVLGGGAGVLAGVGVQADMQQMDGDTDPVDNLVLALGNSSGVMISNAAVDAVWDEAISGHLTAGTTGAKLNTASSGSGSGSTAYTNTVTDDSSNPLDGVEVWITSDSGGASTVASTTTSTLGTFTVYLDPGTYYLWLAKGGYNFPNPTTITVS